MTRHNARMHVRFRDLGASLDDVLPLFCSCYGSGGGNWRAGEGGAKGVDIGRGRGPIFPCWRLPAIYDGLRGLPHRVQRRRGGKRSKVVKDRSSVMETSSNKKFSRLAKG